MTRRIVYRVEQAPDGWWLLFRKVEHCTCCPCEERPVLRAGSTVRPARYQTRAMVLDAVVEQRKADVRAGTRLGVEVEALAKGL